MLKYLLLTLLLAASACSQNYSDERVPGAVAGRSAGEPAPAEAGATMSPGQGLAAPGVRHSLGGLSAVMPEGWRQAPPSSAMRRAEYELPGADGAGEATLAVFCFGSTQGGGLEANIHRWYGQFSQPDGGSTRERARRWERQVRDMRVAMVDVGGTYDAGAMAGVARPTGPQPGYRMLGAVVESPVGSFYLKLTGPQATVARWEASLQEYVDSLRPE